ncbi:UDP-2,4-diacetamido-2,4,6-trideoxy-beta-L-altropyranose hydrolase [Bdellovibrio reynosensis]|uniref:UDP-2,4-diacetamido-2,4, 6-trideoxy-beta-L-altropyranose hydrolase n=2 Tax=Bdellovibrio reynosensis TaxID=2835041 RepID=A0ABY4CBV0_9BACT|nr:UDP-2,4-diacetamido-2,4,6-trideoxy-beta-L-altropyranose hydrolase [Bdellovibrio reynosensis]UOF02254.1 UDP-2,4-diacetamido-2,4,6-trideoxy-beta-L-altropyranose hydrolase [Bdellovibrio reynosensis]
MRCLTLANAFKEAGHTCIFVCKAFPEKLHSLIPSSYTIITINSELNQTLDAQECVNLCHQHDINLVVVDNYYLDILWEKTISGVAPVVCIDDLANRNHDCKILIDSNYYHNAYSRYSSLVPENCKLLLGPRYALIRNEFYTTKKVTIPDHSALKVFCFFGGTDPSGETLKLIRTLHAQAASSSLQFVIVYTKANSEYAEIQKMPASDLYILHESPPSMAELMAQCHLYFGSGGTVTWERMCLGLTGFVVAVADNQIQSATDLATQGFHTYCGEASKIQYEEILKRIELLTTDRVALKTKADKCMHFIGRLTIDDILNNLSK